MKIIIENFGPIKKRTVIEPKLLTIFMGANNTGKTYALYLLNALLDSRVTSHFSIAKSIALDLAKEGKHAFQVKKLCDTQSLAAAGEAISKAVLQVLPQFFVAEPDFCNETKLAVQLNEPEFEQRAVIDFSDVPHLWSERSLGWRTSGGQLAEGKLQVSISDGMVIFSLQAPPHSLENNLQPLEMIINSWLCDFYLPERAGRDFLLPAERSGINLFFRELNSRRAALLRHVTSQTLNSAELLKDIFVSKYPQPIQDYIEFLQEQPDLKRLKSEFSDLADGLQKDVLKTKYKIDRNGDISILPPKSNGANLGLHLGSSTVKTFFGLWSYLNHVAKAGDWLMIDEPELNLHPQNQLLIATLLAQLVNRGVRVVVSTHSDYMVRQWGNLAMLSHKIGQTGLQELGEKLDLPETAWVSPEKVAAYEFDAGTAKALAIKPEAGIVTELFDENIQKVNLATQEIYFSNQE